MIKKDRLITIDLLRGIAVILMFITHSYRLQIINPNEWLPNQLKLDFLFNFFMYIEPFTSALFLFLAGYSFSLLSQKLSEQLAKEFNVGEKTIRRDADFAKGLELLPVDTKNEVLQGKSSLKKTDIIEIMLINSPYRISFWK